MPGKPHPPQENEIHLWWADFKWRDCYPPAPLHLTAAERDLVTNAFSPQRKRELSYGRSHLRALLGNYLGEVPTEIPLFKGSRGRLSLAEPKQNLDFNLSHSEGHAVYAFSSSYRIGIDIEDLRRNVDVALLAKRVFSENEKKIFEDQASSELQRSYFFDVWTKKEAFVKLTGEGLQQSFADIEVAGISECFFWNARFGDHVVSVAYAANDLKRSAAHVCWMGCCL